MKIRCESNMPEDTPKMYHEHDDSIVIDKGLYEGLTTFYRLHKPEELEWPWFIDIAYGIFRYEGYDVCYNPWNFFKDLREHFRPYYV